MKSNTELLIIIAIVGLVFIIGVLEGAKTRLVRDRTTECKVYIQGHYLDGNCWKGDTIALLRVK